MKVADLRLFTGVALALCMTGAVAAEPADLVTKWRAVSNNYGMRTEVGAVPHSRQGDVAQGFLRMQHDMPQRTFDQGIEYDRMDGELEIDCVNPAYRPMTGRAYLKGVLVQPVVGEPAKTASPAPKGGQAMEMIAEACAPKQAR